LILRDIDFSSEVSTVVHLCEGTIILIDVVEGVSLEVVQKKLKRGEVYGLQSNNGTKLIKLEDKRDVLMIYTKPSHSAT